MSDIATSEAITLLSLPSFHYHYSKQENEKQRSSSSNTRTIATSRKRDQTELTSNQSKRLISVEREVFIKGREKSIQEIWWGENDKRTYLVNAQRDEMHPSLGTLLRFSSTSKSENKKVPSLEMYKPLSLPSSPSPSSSSPLSRVSFPYLSLWRSFTPLSRIPTLCVVNAAVVAIFSSVLFLLSSCPFFFFLFLLLNLFLPHHHTLSLSRSPSNVRTDGRGCKFASYFIFACLIVFSRQISQQSGRQAHTHTHTSTIAQLYFSLVPLSSSSSLLPLTTKQKHTTRKRTRTHTHAPR